MVLEFDLVQPMYGNNEIYTIENIGIGTGPLVLEPARTNVDLDGPIQYLIPSTRTESILYAMAVMEYRNRYRIETDYDWDNSRINKETSPGYYFMKSEGYQAFLRIIRTTKLKRILQ